MILYWITFPDIFGCETPCCPTTVGLVFFFSIIFYLPSTNKFFFFLHVLKLHLNYHLPPQLYLDISFNIINMITEIDSCQQSCPYHVSIIKPDIRLPSFMLEIIILKNGKHKRSGLYLV